MVRLIIGLGNPGREYDGTRHNVGFRVADTLAKKLGVEYKTKRRFNAVVGEARDGETAVVIVKPLTYMNLSGQAVQRMRDWYHALPQDVVVVVDDADLELGRLRLRAQGSSGGHRGLDSVIEALGTDGFARLRLGIGRQANAGSALADHVLSRFTRDEEKVVADMVERAVDALESLLSRGLAATMNDFNQRRKEAE